MGEQECGTRECRVISAASGAGLLGAGGGFSGAFGDVIGIVGTLGTVPEFGSEKFR
jgi:hypothetical protein